MQISVRQSLSLSGPMNSLTSKFKLEFIIITVLVVFQLKLLSYFTANIFRLTHYQLVCCVFCRLNAENYYHDIASQVLISCYCNFQINKTGFPESSIMKTRLTLGVASVRAGIQESRSQVFKFSSRLPLIYQMQNYISTKIIPILKYLSFYFKITFEKIYL